MLTNEAVPSQMVQWVEPWTGNLVFWDRVHLNLVYALLSKVYMY